MADKTVTVGPAQTYASLNAALAGEIADLTDAAYFSGGPGRLIIDCYDFEDTTVVNQGVSGWTTSDSYYVLIRAVDDHAGKYSTSSYRLSVGVSVGVACQIDQTTLEHIHFQGIQIYHPSNVTNSQAIRTAGAPTTGWFKFEKCIVILGDDVDDALVGIRLTEINTTYYIWNTLVYGAGGNATSAGIQMINSSATYIYNCTIDDIATGLDLAAGASVRLKNTRITNVTTISDQGLHADSDYNLTDGDASSINNWGANSIDSGDTPTISYVDDDNANLLLRDYHIEAGDTGVGAAADLSGDADNPFTDDIDGETRG